MPTIRQRIAKLFLSDELDKIGQVYDQLIEGYRRGPAVLSTETLAANLKEVDSQLLDLILRQRGYDPLIGMGITGFYEFSESDRLRAVDDSRHMYHFNVQSRKGVKIWTDFGFGQTFSVMLENPQAQAVLDEFLQADRNAPLLSQRKIQKLSNDLIKDGEIFLVFYQSAIEDITTIRKFSTKEIKDIVYADDDEDIPLFYVRSEDGNDVYYPDWIADPKALDSYELPQGAIRADRRGGMTDFIRDDQEVITEPNTDVKVLHVMFEELNGRGWPIFNTSFPWARAYTNNLRDHATVARAVASMVDEITHTGGSRTQADLMSQINTTLSSTTPFDSNAPPVAGSTGIHNEGITLNRRPLTTGAADAQKDSMILLGQVAAADGAPAHWRGRTDMAQNRSVAQATERPFLEEMQRYQTFWKSIIKDIVRIVLMPFDFDISVSTSAEVFMQSPFVLYPDEAAPIIAAINTSAKNGTIDYQVAIAANEILVGMVLNTYGVSNVRELFDQAKEEQPSEESQAVLATAKAGVTAYREGNVSPDGVIEYLYSTLREYL